MSKIELFDYQKEQVQEALHNNKTLNLSEVGTGKTFVGLDLFKQSGLSKLLIICLSAKVSDFPSDGSKVGLGIIALKGTPKRRDELLEAHNLCSISFESVWRTEKLKSWVDDNTMILIDESHKVKSRGSKVGKFVAELSKQAGLTYLMTATPVSNGHLEDYYQQLVIAGIWKGTWKDFKQRYIIEELKQMRIKGMQRNFLEITDYQNEDELNNLVLSHAVAKKREISDELLPEDIFYYVKKPKMYNVLKKDRVIQLDDGTIEEMDSTSKMFHSCRQLCSGVLKGVSKVIKKEKNERVQQILEENENDKLVIFYNYKSELSALKEVCTKLKRPISIYNGDKHDLRNYKKHNNAVALVQYKSGSTGINDFIESQVCIFYSVPDSSTTYIQAKGRLNRHGQTRKPVFYHLICEKSVESELFNAVKEGKDMTNELMERLVKSI